MTKQKTKRVKETASDRFFMGCVYFFVLLMFLITLYPLIYVLSASFSDPDAVASGKMLLFPVGFNMDGYETVFKNSQVWIGYRNTILYTIVGTLMQLCVTMPAAYALSRRDLYGKGLFTALFLFTMYFSGGLVPTYINLNNMGLINTPWVMLLSGLVSVYNLIVARTFFQNTIPWELTEASFIDGATNFQLFLKVILPLSAPITVVLALYYGVGHWNSYFNAMVYLRDRELYPLQVFLKEILTQAQLANEFLQDGGYSPAEMELLMARAEVANRMKYCVIVVSTVPMMLIYPRLQKYFAKGVMIGSVKG